MSESAIGVCLPRAGFLTLWNPTQCCSAGLLPYLPPSFLLSVLKTQRNVNCILWYKCIIKLSVHNVGVALSFLHTLCPPAVYSLSPKFSTCPSSLVYTSGPSSRTQPSSDVRVSFPLFHALSQTQRAFLRVWSGTKRLVVLAVDLCCDVLCCDLLISDGKHSSLPQTHERSPLSFHLADPSRTRSRWGSNYETYACALCYSD